MENRIFDRQAVELLLSPEKWQFITAKNQDSIQEQKSVNPQGKQLDSHPMREIMVAISGQYTYAYNHKFYNCPPGTIFLIDSNMPHENYYTSDAAGLFHIWIYSGSKKTVLRCTKINQKKFEIFAWTATSVTSEISLNRLWDEYNLATTSFAQFCCLQKMRLALGILFCRLLENPTFSDHRDYLQSIVELTKDRIQKEFRNGINIDQLARSAGYSRYHFVRVFKQYANCTIQEYIDSCRIDEMEQLQLLGYSQKEIARELGFASPSAFSIWRRKVHKVNLQNP